MTDRINRPDPKSPARRQTLKTLAAGALAGATVLPEKWITPVLRSIALPAHAQTSAPAVEFCTPVDLTLIEGHSGTRAMVVEASGCIIPAQANIGLELTLRGYAAAVLTGTDKGDEASDLMDGVHELLIPSAHAIVPPACTVRTQVTTDRHGKFAAVFRMEYGTSIEQLAMEGQLPDHRQSTAAWFDIPARNLPKTPIAIRRDRATTDCAGAPDGEMTIVNASNSTVWHGGVYKLPPGTSYVSTPQIIAGLEVLDQRWYKVTVQTCGHHPVTTSYLHFKSPVTDQNLLEWYNDYAGRIVVIKGPQ